MAVKLYDCIPQIKRFCEDNIEAFKQAYEEFDKCINDGKYKEALFYLNIMSICISTFNYISSYLFTQSDELVGQQHKQLMDEIKEINKLSPSLVTGLDKDVSVRLADKVNMTAADWKHYYAEFDDIKEVMYRELHERGIPTPWNQE